MQKCKRCFNKSFLKECACGCGYIITDRDSSGRLRTYRHNHHPQKPLRRHDYERHYNWKGGKTRYGRNLGYVAIRVGVRDYRPEHRVIMERARGRPLTRNEQVHHKNGIKDDNRLENLELYTMAKHTKLHHGLGTYDRMIASMRTEVHKQSIKRDRIGRFTSGQ